MTLLSERQPFSKENVKLPLAVFATALIFRFICLFQSFNNPLLYLQILDESYYVEFGRAVASGFLLGEKGQLYMDPLYGYLLGGLFWLFGQDLLVTRISQIFLDSINAALVAVIGTRFGGKTAGLAGGLLYAFSGPAAFFSLLILKTTISITLTILFILILLRASDSGKQGWWVALGLIGALAVFTRGNHMIMIVLAPLVYIAVARPSIATFVKNTACYLAALSLALSLGVVRNYAAVGELALLPTQGGRALYICQNPENLTGMYKQLSFTRGGTGTAEADFHREAEKRLGKKLTPGEVSDFWRDETLRFIADNPVTWLKILPRKLYAGIADFEIPDNHSYQLWSQFSWALGLPFPTFAFMFGAGLPGLMILTRRGKRSLGLWIPVVEVFLTVLIFASVARYRMEALPFLSIGAGFSVALAWEYVSQKRFTRLAGLFAAFIALFALSKSFPTLTNMGEDEFYLAKAYLNINNPKSAWDIANEGAKRFPDQERFPRLMGLAALSGGDAETSIKMTEKALALRPDSAEAWHNLGLAYLMKGDAPSAVESLKKASELGRGPISQIALGQAYEAMGDKTNAVASYERFVAEARPGDPMTQKARERVRMLKETVN